jgi:hypothetical protein
MMVVGVGNGVAAALTLTTVRLVVVLESPGKCFNTHYYTFGRPVSKEISCRRSAADGRMIPLLMIID